MTSMRRNDVASTSFRRHVPTRFLINQCQIITILILKSDIIENSRIELREIVLSVPSSQIKVTFIIILPFNLVHRSGGGVVDNTLNYQSRGRKIDPPLLRSFG